MQFRDTYCKRCFAIPADKTSHWQFCCQGLETQGQGRGLENWSSRTRTFLEDNNTAVRQYGEIDMNLNLTGSQWHISHTFVTQSLQDDGAWYFACYVSLLSPRKYSTTWTSEDEDKDLSSKDEDKDLEICPRRQGLSSRTTTLLIGRTMRPELSSNVESHQVGVIYLRLFLTRQTLGQIQ